MRLRRISPPGEKAPRHLTQWRVPRRRRGLGARATQPLEALLGSAAVPCGQTTTAEAAGTLCLAATLVDATRGCEVCCSVLAVPEATLAVGQAMLGRRPPEEAADAMSEVVDVVTGVVKAAFIGDGFTFTLGLPAMLSERTSSRASGPPSRRLPFTYGSGTRASCSRFW